jgi:hypothetical protein
MGGDDGLDYAPMSIREYFPVIFLSAMEMPRDVAMTMAARGQTARGQLTVLAAGTPLTMILENTRKTK